MPMNVKIGDRIRDTSAVDKSHGWATVVEVDHDTFRVRWDTGFQTTDGCWWMWSDGWEMGPRAAHLADPSETIPEILAKATERVATLKRELAVLEAVIAAVGS